MTVNDMLTSKINELNSVRDTLINKDAFLNPDNEIFIYHSLPMSKINGDTGSTPNNLSEIMDKVVLSIMDYVDYISSIPNKESSVIMRDRGVSTFAIVSEKSNIAVPITWTKIGENLPFESVQQYLPVSDYLGFVKMIEIKASHTFRKGGESGVDIDASVVLLRINSRLNICDRYESYGGIIDVFIDGESLYGDDIFIIGFVPKVKILTTSIYYSDLSFSINISGQDDSSTTLGRTIGGTQVGNIIPDVDDEIVNGMAYWSMFTLNDFRVDVKNSKGDTVSAMPPDPNSDFANLFSGNIITEIIVDGISIDVSEHNISYRSGISSREIIVSDTYKLYDKNDTGVSTIVFKNVRPVDIVLEEAISEL